MPPTEIFQWLGGARKTGTLEVEHERVVRQIHFRDGAIRSCGSDYAPTLLGQYLLSRGRIGESELRAALAQQEASGGTLGEILIEAGRLTVEDLERFVAAKIEETIYGLFDLTDGVFRFEPGGDPSAGIVEVDLSVEHVLLQGAKREDDMRRLREFIPNDDVILERAGATLPPAVATFDDRASTTVSRPAHMLTWLPRWRCPVIIFPVGKACANEDNRVHVSG
jgi:hypothetical protein